MTLAAVLFLALFFIWLAWRTFRQSRSKRWRSLPLPPEWKQILKRNIDLYGVLPAKLQDELHGHIQVFLREKNLEGCGGLVLTDEIRVTVAGLACILLLNRKAECYPRLESIVIYPSTYVVEEQRDGKGNVIFQDVRLGESWTVGTVVLAWDDSLRGGRISGDGHNVVLHEFAHQLDQSDGAADGTPILGESSRYRGWVRVFSREFEDFKKLVDLGRDTVMDAYGSTNEAEFFAVATETFFEKPEQMKQRRPELYDQLKKYYRLDPAAWLAEKSIIRNLTGSTSTLIEQGEERRL